MVRPSARLQGVAIVSASYGNFSFILSILWRTFSPLGTQSRSDHLVFLGGASRESLGERTRNLLFIFLVCLYMWRARHSQLLSATRTQFWLHLTFIDDT